MTIFMYFKLSFFSLIFLLITFFVPSQNNHSLYGERVLTSKNLALYFDEAGNIYPDYFIPNDEMTLAHYDLYDWYSMHPKAFSAIAKQYGCVFRQFNTINAQILNDSIAVSKCRTVNAAVLLQTSVAFLIHGFRKPFIEQNGDFTSQKDFMLMKAHLNQKAALNTCFIEVYWDAMYGCCFTTNIKKNDFLFSLFDTAQIHAEATGYALRKVMNQIKVDTLNIITHSLGAKVAVYALFNVKDYSPNELKYQTQLTPQQKRVNICLVAPAIAGIDAFKNYYKRQSHVLFRNQDNYKLAIVFNSDDFVLKKKDNKLGIIGPGPYKHGNTTLGCNYDNAATQLKTYFGANFPNSKIELFDVTKVIGKVHHARTYFSNNNLVMVVKYLME